MRSASYLPLCSLVHKNLVGSFPRGLKRVKPERLQATDALILILPFVFPGLLLFYSK